MNRPSLRELAHSLCAVFPKVDDEQHHLALATYRRLARGMAASLVEIAEDAGIDIEKAQRRRCAAEQRIREGKQGVKMTRLFCRICRQLLISILG